MFLNMQPTAILERRSFCFFGKGLITNSETTVQQLAQDIDSPQNPVHALDKDMTVDNPWKNH